MGMSQLSLKLRKGNDGFREAKNHGDHHHNEEDNVSELSEEERHIDKAYENGKDTKDEVTWENEEFIFKH